MRDQVSGFRFQGSDRGQVSGVRDQYEDEPAGVIILGVMPFMVIGLLMIMGVL